MSAMHFPPIALFLLLLAGLQISYPSNGVGQTFDELVSILRSGPPSEKVKAVELLINSRDPRAIPHLKAALHDDAPAVRQAAEAGIWTMWHQSGNAEWDGLLHEGIALMQRPELEEAVKKFTELIESAPQFAEGYNKRATVLYLLKEFDKSIRDCEATLRLNPDHFGALSGAGLCYLGLKRYRDALTYFRRAIKVNPNMDTIQQYIKEIETHLRDEST